MCGVIGTALCVIASGTSPLTLANFDYSDLSPIPIPNPQSFVQPLSLAANLRTHSPVDFVRVSSSTHTSTTNRYLVSVVGRSHCFPLRRLLVFPPLHGGGTLGTVPLALGRRRDPHTGVVEPLKRALPQGGGLVRGYTRRGRLIRGYTPYRGRENQQRQSC